MRKSFLKSLVATAIVGTTMALTSAVAFASEALDTSNVVEGAVVYDLFNATDATKSVSATVGSGTMTTVFAGNGASLNGKYDFSNTTGLVFDKVATDVDGKVFEKGAKINTNNNKDFSSKNYINVPVKAGDTLYVYASSNDGSGSATLGVYSSTAHADLISDQRAVVSAKDSDGLAPVDEVKFSIPETFTGSSVYIVSEKGDYATVDTAATKNASIYAVVVLSEGSAEEEVNFVEGTVDQTPAVAYVDGKYYAFAAISAAAASDNTTLKINDKVAEQVYASVSVDGLDKSAAEDFASGAAYVYGVELNVNAPAAIDLETLQSKVAITLSAE